MNYPAQLTKENVLNIILGVLDSINDAIVTIDSSHKVILFNQKAEQIFGYSKEEVVGKDLTTIMSHNCARDHRAAVKRYLNTGIPKLIGLHSEIVATRKGNIPFPASITFYVSKLDGETYFSAIIKDLTEIKDMEERLTVCQNLAGLGRMVAEVTHELKNPLMIIGGFARQLKKYIRDESGEKKLEIILKEIERLEVLIRDLKEYHMVKIQSKSQVDINPLIQEVTELFSQTARELNISLRLNLSEGGLRISGNRERLKQVFINLIQNAIDAVNEGGIVQISSRKEGEKALVEIEDNGCGMTEDDMAKIFEPFYTTKPKGTGLGLCVTRKIIEEHEGSDISVESEKGKGTRFRISFPLLDETLPPQHEH